MKKQFLTLALLATVAVGGAFAGSVKRSVPEAGPLDNFSDANCNTTLDECVVGDADNCTINTVKYYGHNTLLGTCNIPLSRTQ